MNIRHNTNGFLSWIKRSWINFFAKFIQTVSQSHFSFAFECLSSRLSTLWRFPSATTLKYFRNYFERLTDWLGLVIIWYKFYFRKTKLNYQFHKRSKSTNALNPSWYTKVGDFCVATMNFNLYAVSYS